jgi:hypothetical protein
MAALTILDQFSAFSIALYSQYNNDLQYLPSGELARLPQPIEQLSGLGRFVGSNQSIFDLNEDI